MNKKMLLLLSVSLLISGFRFGSVGLGKKTAEDLKGKVISKVAEPSGPAPKGNRILGMSMSLPEDNQFVAAFDKARGIGVELFEVKLGWSDIETSPGVFNANPNNLAIANGFYPAYNVKIQVIIAVIDTNNITFPSDLTGRSFNDPLVISRFKALLDYVFTQIPELDIASFAIGNEIDGVLGTDTTAWAAYEAFYSEVADYARTKRSGLVVGASATMDSLTTQPLQNYLISMNHHSDTVFASYYPLNPDFTMQDPTIASSEITNLVSIYPIKQIYMVECGYSTGTLVNSSEAKQALFVREMFKVWDTYRTKIPLLKWVWMHDISPAELATYEAQFGSDPKLLEYLRTLGLRTWPGSGTDKEGFTAFKDEAQARGF